MTKTKTVKKKARPAQSRPTESPAFSKAVEDAKAHIDNPERLSALLSDASRKVASIQREPFKDTWPYLQAMLRLIHAYSRNEYRAVLQSAFISIIAALNYLIEPFDLIPDELP